MKEAPAPFNAKYFPSKVAQSVAVAAECFNEIDEALDNSVDGVSPDFMDQVELMVPRAKLLAFSVTTPSYMKWEGNAWKKGVKAWDQWKIVLQTMANEHERNADKYRLIGQLYTDGFMQGLLDGVVAPIIDSKIRVTVLSEKEPSNADARLKEQNLTKLDTQLQLTLKEVVRDFKEEMIGAPPLEQFKKAIKNALIAVLDGPNAKAAGVVRNDVALMGRAATRGAATLLALPLLAFESYRGWVADGFSSQSEVDITTAKNALAALPCEKPGSTPS